ncbi:MAG: FAD/NAD(P)-binding protein [Gammaproteobacteria bacterium]|nr:FAD/NAD(P)-binding protein [Gammaproteobacteria bacterium]
MSDLIVPHEAEVVESIGETPSIFTLRLRFRDRSKHAGYSFAPGQFNMLYLYGVGEVPISIVSDPQDDALFDHTIRAVGHVTRGLSRLRPGDRLGIRGPFGRGWPLQQAEGRDVMVITGGLGCAPAVSVINYVMRRRERFGELVIVQGVKHADDLIWQERYRRWSVMEHTQVLIAADVGTALWPWHVGRVTELFAQARINGSAAIVMMCGPEGMMRAAVEELRARGIAENAMWLSLERSMQCAVGRCGHCQIGGKFVCKDGPVFNYTAVKDLLSVRGL